MVITVNWETNNGKKLDEQTIQNLVRSHLAKEYYGVSYVTTGDTVILTHDSDEGLFIYDCQVRRYAFIEPEFPEASVHDLTRKEKK